MLIADNLRDEKPRRSRPAAFSLVLLTPLIAELALGSTPIRMAWLVILWVPIYGAGVLLIRELATRAGRGWPSILLLAVGYELLEDGVGLQALTSPHLYGAAEWGMRVLGVNLPYGEANVIYHAVFTVAIPIALTDLLFPRSAGRPYLGRVGLVVAAVITVLGVLVLRVSVPPVEDPGYQAPLPFVAGCLLAVVVLGVVALVALPRAPGPATEAPVPNAPVLAAFSGVATLVFFVLTFPLPGAQQPAFTQGALVVIPMVAAAALGAVAVVLIGRMSRSTRWTRRHTLWLLGGALVAHSVGGLVIMAHTPVDRVGLVVIVALEVLAVVLIDRRLGPRRRISGSVVEMGGSHSSQG